MEGPVISVIVPVFNAETYLAACLDSILSQSYRSLEIIVINDGSTDFSLDIARQYAETEDRVTVYSYENSGLSEARNHGLAVATGDFVSFVDADDMVLPRAFEVLMKMILKYEADVSEGTFLRGKTLVHTPPPKKFPYLIYSSEEAIKDVLYQKRLYPSAWGKIYKISLFDNLRFEKGLVYEDLDIFYRIYDRIQKLVWVDFPVYFYRDTEGSIINTWNEKRLDVLNVTERMENFIAEKHPGILSAAKDRRLSANFNMYSLCEINGDRQNAGKCWEVIKSHRKNSLFDKRVRFKNKAGILLSYLGKDIFNIVARRFYK